jgi:hypothetical protein
MGNSECDFDLQILKAGERYQANVLQSPAGEAHGEFSLSFTGNELNDLFRGLGQARKATRGSASPVIARSREFGTRLFDTVFAGNIRDCFNDSRGTLRAKGRDLCIRLRLTNVPELLDLPWELLFDQRHNRFVVLDGSTTLVRHLPVAEQVSPMRVTPPLRVLLVISNPRGDLNVEKESSNVTTALENLKRAGLVVIHSLAAASFEELKKTLGTDSFHVLHFIGHGHYDPARQQGYLSFETARPDHLTVQAHPKQEEAEDQTPLAGESPVGGTRLAELLRPHGTLRLVVLNACEGGRASREDAFVGVAQALVQIAIPAVVAMQFPVTDVAAVDFAGEFYGALASGKSVDLALAAARRGVSLKGAEGDIEWATPVLYMRGDGQLFDVAASDSSRPRTDFAANSDHGKNPQKFLTGPIRERRAKAAIVAIVLIAIGIGAVVVGPRILPSPKPDSAVCGNPPDLGASVGSSRPTGRDPMWDETLVITNKGATTIALDSVTMSGAAVVVSPADYCSRGILPAGRACTVGLHCSSRSGPSPKVHVVSRQFGAAQCPAQQLELDSALCGP